MDADKRNSKPNIFLRSSALICVHLRPNLVCQQPAKLLRIFLSVLVGTIVVAGLCLAQGNAGKKSYTFHGKVEAIEENTKTLRVNGDEVKGWMAAMTMSYPVDKPDVLKSVKVGDTIRATVYQGEMTLHDVMVMPPGKQDKKNSQ